MSKTSQENKAKKAKTESVEVLSEVETQKAVLEETKAEETTAEVSETPAEESHKVKVAKIRGKKYQAAKKKVDVNKYYSLKEAISLVKETSFSKFDGKIEAHVTTYDIGNVGEIVFPHLETASKKIVVLNDTI